MTLVLDSSVTLAWLFADKTTPRVQSAVDQVVNTGGTAPALWRLAVANTLTVAVRRGRIDRLHRDRALAELTRLPITVDLDCATFAWTTTLGLADRCRLTLYDAAYLELAQRHAPPLAALDRALRKAAEMVGVECPDLTA